VAPAPVKKAGVDEQLNKALEVLKDKA